MDRLLFDEQQFISLDNTELEAIDGGWKWWLLDVIVYICTGKSTIEHAGDAIRNVDWLPEHNNWCDHQWMPNEPSVCGSC